MQQQIKKPSSHIYDYAVIGSGLTGLCVANALSKLSTNVILLEGADSFGGFNRSINTKLGLTNNGIRFLPSSELTQKALAFLEVLMATSLNPQDQESAPLSYESSGFKPFVGFGNNPPSFYEEIMYFAASSRTKLNLEPHEWTQVLFSNYSGHFSPRSIVTKFNANDGVVNSCTVNGQKTVLAHNFIYTGSVRDLRILLPTGTLSHRAHQKLSKNKFWTAICLDLIHADEVTTSESMHILNGTTEDDIGPCAGFFQPATEVEGKKMQFSQWISFIDNEESEDSENVGAVLKKMKRQIKRAYPTALDNLINERIFVIPNFSGNGELKLSGDATIPGLKNLWIASGAMNNKRNILGSLLQAEFVCSALGCHPLGTQVETQLLSNEMPEIVANEDSSLLDEIIAAEI